MKNKNLFLILIALLQSCKSQNMDIEKIIEKFDTVDFNKLRNKSIYFRSEGSSENTSIYFINRFRGKCSPYVVEFQNINKSIIEIRNHLVLKSCDKDYLDKQDIEMAIKQYVEYKLCLLQIDEDGNVYINPSKQDFPIFLRRLPNSTPNDINQYNQYKGNWYIRK